MSSIKYFLKLILYQPLYNALIFLVWLMPAHNVGAAIIILTIIIRLILLPSSLKATRQQKRMRDLAPEIQALQAKYKDDKQKQAQAMMEFYKENQVNPLGSCLPLLIQLPILIILYYVFINGLDTQRFVLLYSFMPRPEFLNTSFFGLDLAKPDKFILPVLAGILQYFQSRQLMAVTAPSGSDKAQEMQAMLSKQMMYLMPIFTIIIAGRLPAALPLYWAVTTLFAIVQQWWVFRDKGEKGKEKKEKRDTREKPATITKRGVEVTVRKKK